MHVEAPVERHDPALYVPSGFADGIETFDDLNDAWMSRYLDEGYLVVRRAFERDEVEAARQGLLDLITGREPSFTGLMFEAKAREVLPSLAPEERQDVVRKLMSFIAFDARLKAMAEHPKLLAVLTRLLGKTPELFQDMALIKPPFGGREKPWHQDNAYFPIPVDTHVIGVWIALDAATIENGCMHVLPGGHKAGPHLHFQRRDWQICDTEFLGRKCAAVPLEPGGCLFFHGLMPHGTPTNQSPHRRRALQFHYRAAGVEKTSDEDRLAIFGGEGKDVTC